MADPQALAQVAAALSQHATIGRLRQVCERWIYSACLCFGLSVAEQQHSGFRYDYSADQAEYSRNLLFRSGAQMDRVVNTLAASRSTTLLSSAGCSGSRHSSPRPLGPVGM